MLPAQQATLQQAAPVAAAGAQLYCYNTSANRGICLEHVLCFLATVCDAVLPPVKSSEQSESGAGASSRARFAAILSYFNAPEGSAAAAHAAAFRQPAVPPAAAGEPRAQGLGPGSAGSGSTGRQLGSASSGSSSQHEAVTALAGSAVHIMRVLEVFCAQQQ
jgi:hypothetical protein